MTARHWWAGISLLVAALLLHAAFPRYDWRAVPNYPNQLVRVDRWTGQAQLGFLTREGWQQTH